MFDKGESKYYYLFGYIFVILYLMTLPPLTTHHRRMEPKDKPDALNHLPFFLTPEPPWSISVTRLYVHRMNVTACWSVTSLSCLFEVFGANVTTNLCRDQRIWLTDPTGWSSCWHKFWGKRGCLARGHVNEPEIIQRFMRIPAKKREKKKYKGVH